MADYARRQRAVVTDYFYEARQGVHGVRPQHENPPASKTPLSVEPPLKNVYPYSPGQQVADAHLDGDRRLAACAECGQRGQVAVRPSRRVTGHGLCTRSVPEARAHDERHDKGKG